MERCPCCNARLKSASRCARCQTDLSLVSASEQGARQCLNTAIYHWRSGQIESSLKALQQSQQLKSSPLAKALVDLLLDRQCNDVLKLLAQEQTLAAKKRLYPLIKVFPDHRLLQQLDDFIDYRLTMTEHSAN